MYVIRNAEMSRTTGGGGGGGVLAPNFGMCRGKVKNGGELERENTGLRSELESESGRSLKLAGGRVWLALWPATNPGALKAFGLAAVLKPTAGGEWLERKEIM